MSAWPPKGLPRCRVLGRFRLEALGPEHNERDHEAWMSSVEHIRATAGFVSPQWSPDEWPTPMSLEDNLVDLERHQHEFDLGEAYTFSVLAHPSDDVIGCVYVYPDTRSYPGELGVERLDVRVRSWVTDDCAADDGELAAAVDAWVRSLWPETRLRWPGRDHLSG